jgi:hypothetical protein
MATSASTNALHLQWKDLVDAVNLPLIADIPPAVNRLQPAEKWAVWALEVEDELVSRYRATR